MSRGAAWDRALRRPPIVKINGRWYTTYREHKYSGYRKSHTEHTWRWYVHHWQPLEESLKGQTMLEELKRQLAENLFGWLKKL